MKHTPGPWKVVQEAGDEWYFGHGACEYVIKDADDNSLMVGGESQGANAQLIAAAPELLEALILVMPLAKGWMMANQIPINIAVVKQAEEAIKKAEGQPTTSV